MRTEGLLDLQVNGFAGVDFNAADLSPKALDAALEAMLATGVTACLPTIITATPDELMARLGALDRAVAASRLGPLMVPGYHLEGPFLNPTGGYAGCHPAEAMRPPDAVLVERLEKDLARPILLITVAPELPGGPDFVRAMAGDGQRLVAIGHSAVDGAAVAAAVAAGATMSTHLGNGLPQMLPKLDNAFFHQLAEDRLTATLIADGIHVPPATLKVVLRTKGPGRAALVTDAVSAAATPPGVYPFAGMMVEHADDGSVRMAGGLLAGSALTLDRAVRNLVAWGLASPEEAMRMASELPRHLLAPVLARRGLALPASEVWWSAELRPERVRLDGVERRYALKSLAAG